MTKETKKIMTFLFENVDYNKKVSDTRVKHNNAKDFTNGILYIIMDVVSKEEQFFGMNRSNIDVNRISQEFFV